MASTGLFARFRTAPPVTNVNKSAMINAVSRYASAVNAQKRAAINGTGNAAGLTRNVNAARNVAHKSMNSYLNRVIQLNVNKVRAAQTTQEQAQGAANIAAATKVKEFLQKMKIENNKNSIDKLQKIVNGLNKGGAGSRTFSTGFCLPARVTANMNAELKKTLQTMINKYKATMISKIQAENIDEIRQKYIQAFQRLGPQASVNSIRNTILAYRNSNNKNRNLSAMSSTGNQFNQYFKLANAVVKARGSALTAMAGANANKVFRIENKNVTIKKQANGTWKIMNADIASRWMLNSLINPTRAMKAQNVE